MKKVYGKNGVVNVRKSPTTASGIITTINMNIGAEYIGQVGPLNGKYWHQVKINEKLGYVRGDVSVVKEDLKERIIDGYSFPDKPIRTDIKTSFSKEMQEKYLPVIEKIIATRGTKLLITVMAHKEGYSKGTRSFKTNNPGNIGNTDNGKNSSFTTLQAGIEAQIKYIEGVANGTNKAHRFGMMKIDPFFSREIARNQKTYGIDPYLPGYRFDYKGQLGAFVKIYSTGARGANGYLSQIISYFNQNGIEISEHTTISEIISIS